jgi:hypothetical protein
MAWRAEDGSLWRRSICIDNLSVMATETAYPGDDPQRLLSNTRELAQRVRKAQRATWFPLLVFAAVTFASIPVYRYSGHHLGTCVVTGPGLRACSVYTNGEFVYWPVALVLAYAVIAAFYIRRSRARGIETRVRPYAIAGIIIAAALTGAAIWELHNPSASGQVGLHDLGQRLATPASAIGLALLVLAWAERNRALLLLTLGYLAIVLVPVSFGWVMGPLSHWYFVPRLVIDGSVLLLGGIGFALAQRPLRSPAP